MPLCSVAATAAAAFALAAVFQGLLLIAYIVGLLVSKPERRDGAGKPLQYITSAPAGAQVAQINATQV